MINLDRFGGVTEPEDGVYFMTNEQMAEEKEADRLAEIEGLQSEIEDREAVGRADGWLIFVQPS